MTMQYKSNAPQVKSPGFEKIFDNMIYMVQESKRVDPK